jgi:hypothetical protein
VPELIFTVTDFDPAGVCAAFESNIAEKLKFVRLVAFVAVVLKLEPEVFVHIATSQSLSVAVVTEVVEDVSFEPSAVVVCASGWPDCAAPVKDDELP